ncbi:peroxiredoxin [Tieghemostelium lacteum]|uniref:Peroxiredoxin n=1 Tax=Tieghemostelium lacteum TaxID=361077 RepID=A0A151ZJW7_TIELA|nr:peroxiredoxin [Tieghemostelium lacteum]|eukprot:KYQ94292.1 peroxiredoxin [Tieghemostelium lacteum]
MNIINNIVHKMIKVGDKLPEVNFWISTKAIDGACQMGKKVNSTQLFDNKKVVLFAIPGAFTPTCSAKHLPSFVQNSQQIKSKGIDSIICLATNDPFVMSAYERDQNIDGQVTLVSDGNSEFTKKIGMEMDGSGHGLGVGRSKRYAMIVENNIVKSLFLEEPGKYEVSSAEHVLSKL